MNTSSDCERARIALMASLDGENHPESTAHQQHLAGCASCQQWLKELQSIAGRLEGLSYENPRTDLWSGVEAGIRKSEQRSPARAIWPVLALVLGWRALQLVFDLPMPMLHTLVPLVALVATLWLLAGDPLAIETSVPELQKGGA